MEKRLDGMLLSSARSFGAKTEQEESKIAAGNRHHFRWYFMFGIPLSHHVKTARCIGIINNILFAHAYLPQHAKAQLAASG
jgi:hypothetical protein